MPVLQDDSAFPSPPPGSKIAGINRFTIEQFIELIEEGQKRRKGKPGPKLHEAPDLDETQVTVDALFASAVSPFTVTFDGVLHHYGQMAYVFWKDSEKDEWRIQSVTQSYRRTPGWENESVM